MTKKSDASMVGVSAYERNVNDFYPTEAACTEALIQYLKDEHLYYGPSQPMYEPACGDGAIVKVFKAHGHMVHASDLHPQMDGGIVKNFLTDDFMIDRETDIRPLVITNPPYAQPWIDLFIARMIELVKNDGAIGALLMRNEVDCAKSRRPFFQDNPFYHGKLVLNWRPRWVPGSTGSPRHNYAWYVFSGLVGKPTIAYAEKPKV